MFDPYEILGVSRNATDEEIKKERLFTGKKQKRLQHIWKNYLHWKKPEKRILIECPDVLAELWKKFWFTEQMNGRAAFGVLVFFLENSFI